ncbi:MAG: type VI secretion system accessory protein TagJ [Candidatus Krumholzibacteriia bacterium]
MTGTDARALLQAGRLAEAVTAQQAAVKAQPLDAGGRYLLCGLLCFSGEWDRAARQFDFLAHQDKELTTPAAVYGGLLAAERHRAAVFGGGESPLLSPDAPAHALARQAALAAWRGGDPDEAGRRLEAAVAAQPTLAGRLDGREFTALRDLDDLLGSVLEVFAGGRYLWLPLEQVRRLTIAEPVHLLDLLWLPATLEGIDGGTAAVHLPVLYAGSAGAADDQLRLGRQTDWRDEGPFYRGLGQRLLASVDRDGDEREAGLLAVRSLEFDPAA